MRHALLTSLVLLICSVQPMTLQAHVLDDRDDRPGADLPEREIDVVGADDRRTGPSGGLQIGGALAIEEPAVGTTGPAGAGDTLKGVVAGFSIRSQLSPSALKVEVNSAVAYPISPKLSLGVDYAYVEGEDLIATHAEIGSFAVDHGSHNLVLKARWRF